MSAFIVSTYADRLELLTDGAVYTPDGILTDIQEKVYRLTSVPCAITARGATQPLKILGATFDMVAALLGFDGLLEWLPSSLEKIGARDGAPSFEMVIAGISESQGPVVYYFSTAKAYAEYEPFKLYRITDVIFVGGGNPKTTPRDMIAAGLTIGHFNDGLADHGADLMEVLRRQKAVNPTVPGSPEIHGIGGHVDHTVISTAGATTTRLRTWPEDKIGEKINPFAADKPVKISRQQRRASERKLVAA